MSVEDNGEQWSYHTTSVKNESVRMVIELFNETYCHVFTVYLRKDKKPTTEKYDMKWYLPNNSSCKWKNETKHDGDIIDFRTTDAGEYECDHESNVIFISDKENLDGSYQIGKINY